MTNLTRSHKAKRAHIKNDHMTLRERAQKSTPSETNEEL